MSGAHVPVVDGVTRIYGIIGDPIAQVRSPAVFTETFRALGKNAVMIPLHVRRGDFDACMRGFKSLANLDGMLVTIPFKNTVMNHVDLVLPSAGRIGAMNALRREADGKWSGDMFDGAGFLGGLRSSGLDPKDLSVMLIGAGGAGSAIADALAEAGAGAITIFDRHEDKAKALARRITQFHPKSATRAGRATVDGIDLLINASPTGMAAGDELPAALEPFGNELFVADIIPRSEPTPLLALAKERGCRTMAGQAMVAGQADAILRFFGLS
jgi:shikimate dehydrogenase